MARLAGGSAGSGRDVIIAVVLGILTSLGAGEVTSVSPWCAKRLARWSAFRRYAENPQRAQVRAEELGALVEARPGNLLKLFTALGFAAVTCTCRLLMIARRIFTELSRKTPASFALPSAAAVHIDAGPAYPALPSFDLDKFEPARCECSLASGTTDGARRDSGDLAEMRIDEVSALERLPVRQFEAIRLHILLGYSLRETAAILDTSVAKVVADLRAGLGYLRRCQLWRDI